MESSDCAAALDPNIFHNHGGIELERFLDGAKVRGETALLIGEIGDAEDSRSRNPLFGAGASIVLPKAAGSIGGRQLPIGVKPTLAPKLTGADRDLGLRLLSRPADAPWWSLSASGMVSHPGDGGPAVQYQLAGDLEPILLDGLGDPVAAAWVPDSGDQRWYVIPAQTPWSGILDWLFQLALPAHVPGALRRARSSHAIDPALHTPGEASARQALEELDSNYAQERRRLEGELESAKATADPMRHALLFGTGTDLERAVAAVLVAAGCYTTDLDEMFGETISADILAEHEQERRLVEVKSASGSASESLAGSLARHLQTWPELRPDEPVGGGVLIVNHQHRLDPDQRTADVYSRPEFVASLTIPVIATRQLFDWWRDTDWEAIRDAVFARPDQHYEAPVEDSPTPVSQQAQSSPVSRADDRPRRRFGRRPSAD